MAQARHVRYRAVIVAILEEGVVGDELVVESVPGLLMGFFFGVWGGGERGKGFRRKGGNG